MTRPGVLVRLGLARPGIFGPVLASLALASLSLVGGCSDYHNVGPEAWWHDAIGGKIAEERPPPPGDKDPYPNLATVPPRPAATDTAAWNRMTTGLITDRINAHQAAALAPIPASASPAAAKPVLDINRPEPGASAALVGAGPPPVSPPAAPPGAPPGASPASSGPAAQSKSAQAGPVTSPGGANQAERVANGQLPALPTQEPERSDIAPRPPPAAAPMTAVPPQAAPRAGTVIDFARASSALNDAALREVKSVAAVRGDLGIAVTGYGDATTSDAARQSDAVGLGWTRAQALATALVAQGVPIGRLRVNAEAAGRGASLRLLQ